MYPWRPPPYPAYPLCPPRFGPRPFFPGFPSRPPVAPLTLMPQGPDPTVEMLNMMNAQAAQQITEQLRLEQQKFDELMQEQTKIEEEKKREAEAVDSLAAVMFLTGKKLVEMNMQKPQSSPSKEKGSSEEKTIKSSRSPAPGPSRLNTDSHEKEAHSKKGESLVHKNSTLSPERKPHRSGSRAKSTIVSGDSGGQHILPTKHSKVDVKAEDEVPSNAVDDFLNFVVKKISYRGLPDSLDTCTTATAAVDGIFRHLNIDACLAGNYVWDKEADSHIFVSEIYLQNEPSVRFQGKGETMEVAENAAAALFMEGVEQKSISVQDSVQDVPEKKQSRREPSTSSRSHSSPSRSRSSVGSHSRSSSPRLKQSRRRTPRGGQSRRRRRRSKRSKSRSPRRSRSKSRSRSRDRRKRPRDRSRSSSRRSTSRSSSESRSRSPARRLRRSISRSARRSSHRYPTQDTVNNSITRDEMGSKYPQDPWGKTVSVGLDDFLRKDRKLFGHERQQADLSTDTQNPLSNQPLALQQTLPDRSGVTLNISPWPSTSFSHVGYITPQHPVQQLIAQNTSASLAGYPSYAGVQPATQYLSQPAQYPSQAQPFADPYQHASTVPGINTQLTSDTVGHEPGSFTAPVSSSDNANRPAKLISRRNLVTIEPTSQPSGNELSALYRSALNELVSLLPVNKPLVVQDRNQLKPGTSQVTCHIQVHCVQSVAMVADFEERSSGRKAGQTSSFSTSGSGYSSAEAFNTAAKTMILTLRSHYAEQLAGMELLSDWVKSESNSGPTTKQIGSLNKQVDSSFKKTTPASVLRDIPCPSSLLAQSKARAPSGLLRTTTHSIGVVDSAEGQKHLGKGTRKLLKLEQQALGHLTKLEDLETPLTDIEKAGEEKKLQRGAALARSRFKDFKARLEKFRCADSKP